MSQSALHRTDADESHFYGLVEGLVVAHLPPSDRNNLSKTEHEYDVECLSIAGVNLLRNAPRADIMAGVDDGDEAILRPASRGLATGDGWTREKSSRLKSDGDRVVVGFINGNFFRPVILGVLTHRGSRREDAREAKPYTRRMKHRGTNVVLDADGNVTVDLASPPDDYGKGRDVEKKVTVKLGDGLTVTLSNDGTVTLDLDGTKFKLTSGGLELGASPSDFVALSSKVKSALDGIISAFNSHMHATAAPGPPVPPAMPITTVVTDVASTFTKSK